MLDVIEKQKGKWYGNDNVDDVGGRVVKQVTNRSCRQIFTAFWTLLLTVMATPFLLRDSCPQ